MTIYLIRHGQAGARAQWEGHDDLRPLNRKGQRQAERLVELLAGRTIGTVYTSPSLRCVQTVTPLAAARDLTVVPVDELREGADGEAALRFLLAHAGEQPAVCSHGDVIPKVLRRLSATGMRSGDGNESAKGSVWILDVDHRSGAVVRGTYVPADATTG